MFTKKNKKIPGWVVKTGLCGYFSLLKVIWLLFRFSFVTRTESENRRVHVKPDLINQWSTARGYSVPFTFNVNTS